MLQMQKRLMLTAAATIAEQLDMCATTGERALLITIAAADSAHMVLVYQQAFAPLVPTACSMDWKRQQIAEGPIVGVAPADLSVAFHGTAPAANAKIAFAPLVSTIKRMAMRRGSTAVVQHALNAVALEAAAVWTMTARQANATSLQMFVASKPRLKRAPTVS
eukprot:SAG31_NODE_1653_length_7624_cov_3.068970_2_plen_163_part_00